MNVIVCIKQVPETASVEIQAQSGTVVRAKGKPIINPFDMYALEEGVRLKEGHGCKVSVLTMGPPEAEESLREALALGIDQAFLLSDPRFDGSDTLATSHALSRAIQMIGDPGIIICGRQSTDGSTGQVAPQLAEWLGMPFVASVNKIEEVAAGHLKLRRMDDEGHRIVEMSLPGVISVVKEINEPRLPSLRGLMQSKKAKIPVWTAADVELDPAKVGLNGSATRISSAFFPDRNQKAELIEGDAAGQVDQLIEKLRSAGAI